MATRRICSVWSWPQHRFHYYVTSLERGAHIPLAPLRPPLGDPPERLVRRLPPDAAYLGSGASAIGEVVAHASRRRRDLWAR
jgi:hypothetical protein